ncbi:unnamed protein product [Durusdinium trenchii]|uniref:Uncharacterized protein n=1 Tax=Durusdinium trenchii TaxID=1381693 RepID=A0ABP0PRR0_9DINO
MTLGWCRCLATLWSELRSHAPFREPVKGSLFEEVEVLLFIIPARFGTPCAKVPVDLVLQDSAALSFVSFSTFGWKVSVPMSQSHWRQRQWRSPSRTTGRSFLGCHPGWRIHPFCERSRPDHSQTQSNSWPSIWPLRIDRAYFLKASCGCALSMVKTWEARTSSAPGSSHLGERGEPRFKDLQQGFAIAI